MASKKKVKALNRRGYLPEIKISEAEVLEALEFYKFYEIPMDPNLIALKLKLETGGIFTLDDQQLLRKIMAADMAKAVHRVFADEVFATVRTEASEALCDIVKHEVNNPTPKNFTTEG